MFNKVPPSFFNARSILLNLRFLEVFPLNKSSYFVPIPLLPDHSTAVFGSKSPWAPCAVLFRVAESHFSFRCPGDPWDEAYDRRAEHTGSLRACGWERGIMRGAWMWTTGKEVNGKSRVKYWQEFVADCFSFSHYRKAVGKYVNKTSSNPLRLRPEVKSSNMRHKFWI